MASTRLHAHRALVHPLWVGALVVLALNDHWWKYDDLLPAAVTGKLSDFAGLLVAPALLAAIVGVRRRAGLLAAHVAVGVVFTLIQLSRSCADAWAALMDLVAVPWVITSDPTDLVALPMLALGMHVYPRAMQRAAVASLRRTGEAAGAAVGLVCCVATSRPDPGEPVYAPIDADVYVNNDTDEEIVVRIRPLSSRVIVDCDTVATDPGRLLAAPLFDTAQSWTVPAQANVAIDPNPIFEAERDCEAAIVDADGWPSRLVFWQWGQPARTQVAGTGIDPAAPGWVRMARDDDDRGVFEAGMEILFEIDDDTSVGEGACAVQDDGDRNEWSSEVPTGTWSIAALEDGLDGCTAFGLAASHDSEETMRWYLCTPELEVPFAVGDAIDIATIAGVGVEGVRVRAIDLATGDPTFPARELVVSRGSEVATIADLSTSFVAEFDCPFTVDGCGTVARAGVLVVGGSGWPSREIAAGESAVLEHADGAVIHIALAHGQDRDVVDDECALGPAGPGIDVEIAASWIGAAD